MQGFARANRTCIGRINIKVVSSSTIDHRFGEMKSGGCGGMVVDD
jgi:hypothetical protein